MKFDLTWKGIAAAVGIIGVSAGAIYSTAEAWPYVEPLLAAHRGYVRAYDIEQMKPFVERLIRVQVAQNRDRRQTLLDEAAKREIELQGDQAKQLPQYRALIQERVNRISEELKTLDEQDNSLFKEEKTKR